MWVRSTVFVLVLGCGQAADASLNVDKRFPNLKLLSPLFDKVEKMQEVAQLQEVAKNNFKNVKKEVSSNNHNLVQNYIHQIKKYSQLQLSEQLAVTVGSFKAEPLGEVKKELIDIPDVFSPQMDRIENASDRGYGIKFKLEL